LANNAEVRYAFIVFKLDVSRPIAPHTWMSTPTDTSWTDEQQREEQIDIKKLTENTELRTRQRALNDYHSGMAFRNKQRNGVESDF